MREIKFRAWDTTSGGKMEYCSIERVGAYHESMGHHIMQYTGLKDKSGKEIYEGDIVRGKYGKNGIVKNYEIRWLTGHFAAVDRNNITGDEHYYPIGLLEGEVIGNIYENPELLEV